MLRLKRKNGGEVNILASKVVTFIDEPEGSLIMVEGCISYSVNESCQSIRGQMKKLFEE